MRAININIQGYNADGICVGCLNYNRKMFYSDKVKECFKILGKIDVTDRLKIQVCWECMAAIQAVNRFQQQIVKSFDVLMEYSKKHRYLESPMALTKHAATRLTSHVVSITSTQRAEEDGGGSEKVAPENDVEHLEEDETPIEKETRAAGEVTGTSDIKLELEVSDVYADPLAGSDSDNELIESLHQEPMSESEDEVIQFAKLLQSGGIVPRQSLTRRGPHLSTSTIEESATTTTKPNDQLLISMTSLLAKNQKKLLNRLDSLSTRIGPLPNTSGDIDGTHAAPENLPVSLKKITCRQDMEEMESLLRDDDYKAKLINSCAVICSKSPGKGINCAYRFLDVLFCRHFLRECSWSGGTRGENQKIPMKFYKKVLEFFFLTVLQWDPMFTQEENENFMKGILKNAKQRSESKLERASAPRRRRRTYTSW